MSGVAKNDGRGDVQHQPPLFKTFFAAGCRDKYSPDARADGCGGLLKKGYYWKAEGFVSSGPFKTRRQATISALESIENICAQDRACILEQAA